MEFYFLIIAFHNYSAETMRPILMKSGMMIHHIKKLSLVKFEDHTSNTKKCIFLPLFAKNRRITKIYQIKGGNS